MKIFGEFQRAKIQFCRYSKGKNTETLSSSQHETQSIQLHIKSTINDINAVFAPSCTSREFTFKSLFYYIQEHGNAKIAENLSNFGKNDFYFLILVVKYEIRVKTLLMQEMQKCPKNNNKVTIEKAINRGMAYLFTLLYSIFCLEKLVIYGFSSYLCLKESIRNKTQKKSILANLCSPTSVGRGVNITLAKWKKLANALFAISIS